MDLAEELGVALSLLAGVSDTSDDLRLEVVDLLVPFEKAGTLTPKGARLLTWARGA